MEHREFNLKILFITPGLEGIGGKIKQAYEDFIVEEVPLYEPSGDGEHLYVNITRDGMTTRDIQKKLAEIFDVDIEKVGCAGMKDKQSRATQTFSVQIGKPELEELAEVEDKIKEVFPVTVNWVRMHNNKLKPGHLLGNRFTIKIRQISMEPIIALERARAIIAKLKETGLPNFYGPQRFGIGGENIRKGYEIIKGVYSIHDRWLHRLLVSSYQSYLCNRYLAKRIESGNFDKILEGDIAKKYDTGGLFEVTDQAAEQPRYESKEISFTAPIYGAKMTGTKGPSGKLEAQALKDEGMTMEELGKAGANGTRRLGRVLLTEIQEEMKEDHLELKFFLPKGAFATILLREIMKVE